MSNFSREGKIVGTGSALTLQLGFKPDKVKLVNATDGEMIEISRSQLDDGLFGFKTVAAGTRSVLGTAGVGLIDSDPTAESYETQGIIIGATAGINQSAEDIYWEASVCDDPGQ